MKWQTIKLVTVANGVDLGSKDDAYFEGLDESITRKLRPHFGKKNKTAHNKYSNQSTCIN